jgi:hypothetical protein
MGLFHSTADYCCIFTTNVLLKTSSFLNIYNCNWVDTRWQQNSSHLHTNSTQNTTNRTYITITKLNMHKYYKLIDLFMPRYGPFSLNFPKHIIPLVMEIYSHQLNVSYTNQNMNRTGTVRTK